MICLHTGRMFYRVDALNDTAFNEAIERAARYWGSKTGDLRMTEAADLAQKFMAPPTDAMHHHVPTSFSLSDEFSFMPVSWDMRWEALEHAISIHNPRAAAAYLPFHWQTDPIFMAAMHRTKTLGTTILPGNIPLAHEMLRKLGAELAVAAIETAQALFATLDAFASLPVKTWQIVVTPEHAHRTIVLPGHVSKDLHAVPGHSVASQCTYLSGEEFHPSPSYAWHVEERVVFITSLSDTPAPFFRFRLVHGALEQRECPCGHRHVLTVV